MICELRRFRYFCTIKPKKMFARFHTLLLLLVMCAFGAMAQESATETIDSTDVFYRHLTLKEVVVTGSAGETRLADATTPVELLTATDLTAVASTNIIDAVAQLPGVSQVTTGAGISKPVIRGLGYNRIVVVNDGVRQEGQQWGDEHGIELDANTVGSVEVLKGPASLIYGSDALAGVIKFNPLLPPGGMRRASVSTEYQTNNGLFAYSLDFGGNKRGFLWDVRYSEKLAHPYKNKFDGYVPNSQFRERAASAMLGFSRDWGYMRLKGSVYHQVPSIVEGERDEETGELEQPYSDATTYHHGMPYQHVKHYRLALDNKFYVGAGNISLLLAYQQNRRQEYEEIENPNEYGLFLKLHTFNYNAHYTSPTTNGWKWVAGVGGMYQRSLNKGVEFLIPDYNLFDFGIFATANKALGPVVLSGGLRFDHRHIAGESLIDDGMERFAAFKRDFNGVTGSLGAVYHIDERWVARLNVSRGFRTPNVSELASNGVHEGSVRYEVGNVDLKPEYSFQFDAGIDFTSRVFAFSLNAFANHISNYIFIHRVDEVIDPDYDTYRYDHGTARLWGGEASVDIHPMHSLHLGTSFSYVNAVQLHQPIDTRYLPLTPAPRWVSDVKYEIIHKGSLFSNAYIAVQLDYNLKQNHYYRAWDTETATPAYALLNISAGTDIMSRGKHVASLYFIASNVTNKAYQSHLNRLKYTDVNSVTGRRGVYNMGRNFTIKLVVPLTW